MPKRVLVTGVSAYAGFHAALGLAAAGHQVVGLARDPHRPRLEVLRMHEIAIAGADIGRPEEYRALLEPSDVVIHAVFDKAQPFATDRALFAALAALPKRPGRRLVYTTGNSILGKVGVPIVDETVEPNPEHPLAFRRALEREALALEIGVVVLRPGIMYGDDCYNSQLAEWFEMAAAGRPFFPGDREKGWSWIHIDDLSDAYRRAVEADRSIDGEVFFIADEQRPRSVEVMRRALEVAGYAGEPRFVPIEPGDRRAWFDQNEFVTSAKARRLLGWSPRHTSVLDGLPGAYAAWKAAQRLHPSGSRVAREGTRVRLGEVRGERRA